MRRLFLFLFSFFSVVSVWAQDFFVTNDDGVTIYYNRLSSTECEVSSGSEQYFGAITIPESVIYNGVALSVSSIHDGAFMNCDLLTSVTLPSTITSIGEGAFQGCASLSSLDLPDSLAFIGNWAVSNCGSLTSIILPGSLTSIGNGVFAFDYSLTTVDIPSSITSIGSCAFYYCQSLTSLTIPSSITSIEYDAFQWCYFTEQSLVNNSSMPTPDDYWGAIIVDYITEDGLCIIDDTVVNCIKTVTSVNIPEGITSIDTNSFSRCISLTSVNIPGSVNFIGSYAFFRCYSLTSVTNLATTPQLIGSDVFVEVPISEAILYVPEGSIEAYQDTPVWQEFGQILDVEAKPEETSISILNQEQASTPRYDLMGRRITRHSARTIFIEQGKKSLAK